MSETFRTPNNELIIRLTAQLWSCVRAVLLRVGKLGGFLCFSKRNGSDLTFRSGFEFRNSAVWVPNNLKPCYQNHFSKNTRNTVYFCNKQQQTKFAIQPVSGTLFSFLAKLCAESQRRNQQAKRQILPRMEVVALH